MLNGTGGVTAYLVKLVGLDVDAPDALTVVPRTEGPSNATSIEFDVVFSEPVSNFDDVSDLMVAHSGTANTGATITGGPLEFVVTVTGISGDGTFTVAVDVTSDVVDGAGNTLTSSDISVPVTIDMTAPVIVLTDNTEAGNTVDCGSGDYEEPGATASDNSGFVAGLNFSGHVLTDTPGTYTITYNAFDEAGNSVEEIRMVTVLNNCGGEGEGEGERVACGGYSKSLILCIFPHRRLR